MIEFVALSFTALCRELAYCRKAPEQLSKGFFVFNCAWEHVFGWPDMEADFGDDKPCSELVDMMSRYMMLNEADSREFIQRVQSMLAIAEGESRLYCLKGMGLRNPQATKKLLVLGAMVQQGRLLQHIDYEWLESRNGLESWMESAGVEVIR